MTLEEVLSQLERLPAFPAVVQEVIASLGATDVDIEELARRIGHDQALTAKILQVANSPFYGFPREIASIQDAVVIMGLAGVRSLVLAAAFTHTFGHDQRGVLNRVEYWKRSFRIASYARAVAKCCNQPTEIAFITGMLHDVGQLVLDAALPEQYAAAVAKADAEGCSLLAAEEAVLGFHHGVLGGEVARRWNFPAVIEQAIRDCHSSSQPIGGLISAVVCMGIQLDRGEAPATVVETLLPAMREGLGLDAGRLTRGLPDREELEASVARLL